MTKFVRATQYRPTVFLLLFFAGLTATWSRMSGICAALKRLEKIKQLEVEGARAQCPVAGDANEIVSSRRSLF